MRYVIIILVGLMKRRRLKRKWKYFLVIILLIFYIGIFSLIKDFKNEKIKKEQISTGVTTNRTTKQARRQAKLTLVGDFLFEAPFYKAIENGYEKEKYFSLVKHYFEEDDLSIGNMEVVIGNENMSVSGDGYSFCAPTYVGDLVNSLDLEVLSTANNHVYDRGIAGINSTLDYFRSKTDIMTVGTYKDQGDRDKDHILEINGIKFGFLAYTYGTNQHVDASYRNLVGLYRNPNTRTMDEEYKNILIKEITNLREKVDVLLVMMHWGNEFTFTPNSNQLEMANFLNSLKVDIVYGSHSHSIQPIDIIGDEYKTLVYYSLGNFVSHDDDIARTPKGQETFDNAYQLGLLSNIELEIVDNKVVFNKIDTDLIVNYFNTDMSDFLLIPYQEYSKEYETKHLRYPLGLTKDFITSTYESVIDQKYRN